MYHLHQHCRACGYAQPAAPGTKSAGPTEKLEEVFDLGVQPLANDFCKEGQERAGYAPLSVLLCPRCHLAQLSVVVDPKILYSRYHYVTSQSETMREHFADIYTDITTLQDSPTLGKVLEIASNDGLLLEHFRKFGADKVLGIDPAVNLCAEAKKRGIETVPDFFGKRSAEQLALIFHPDVILARHVLCHCPDWKDFVAGLEQLAGPSTLICLETPYVQDLLAKAEFDTIYHEHLSYLSIRAIVMLLQNTSLHLWAVKRYRIHGGAVMLYIRRRDCDEPPQNSVRQFLDAEDVGPNKWQNFSVASWQTIVSLTDQIRQLRASGKSVAALGASAKLTVTLNAMGLRRQHIAFVADTTMSKWYSTVPGTGIPVTDEGAILRELPDYVLCGAWNFREEILRKNELARSKGVKFIFHVPKLEIV